MPLAFLGDENLPGSLNRAIQRHNARGLYLIDFIRVGNSEDLPLGSDDSTLLSWAEQHNRILLSLDARTMPAHLEHHLRAGRHVPGIFMIHSAAKMAEVIEFLVLAAYASSADEWRDQIRYFP